VRKRSPETIKKDRARSVAWALKNLQLVRSRSRKWANNNIEKNRLRARNWHHSHPERAKKQADDFRKKNPTYVASASAKRRARQRKAPGRGITANEWREILAASLGICVYCNERRKLTLDHIDPLNGGGDHDIENAAAACSPCNISKSDSSLLLWLARRVA
jgi:HNH endonuclease